MYIQTSIPRVACQESDATLASGGEERLKTILLQVDDELDLALTAVCAERGSKKDDLVAGVLTNYLASERSKRILQDDPALAELYAQLAPEDAALAEEGISEYQRLLEQADKT